MASRARPSTPARRAIDGIAAEHAGQTVAVVSHNGLLTSYLAQLLDGAPWANPRYDFGYCTVAEVELSDGSARLVRRTACEGAE